MSGKSFNDMTLDEVFDLEQPGSAHVGRSVVTADGLARAREKKPASRQFYATGSFKIGTNVSVAHDVDVKVGTVYHLLHNGKAWQLRKGRARVANLVSRAANQRDAVREAVRYVKHHGGGSVTVHNRDGSIREERTFPRTAGVTSNRR